MPKSAATNGWSRQLAARTTAKRAAPAKAARDKPVKDKPTRDKAAGKPPASPAQVYDQLRFRIATRSYPPGTRLSETDLAAEFGLSRTPVRQALQLLAADGLVSIKNGVGVTVTDMDRTEIDQAYHLRCELAAMMGANSPKPLSAEQLAELESVRAGTVTLLKQSGRPSLEEFSDLCERFHNVINDVIGSRMLRNFIEILYHQTDRFWYGWMERADIRIEVTHFLHEVEETQRALEIDDFQAVGYIRRNHITMMLARMAQVREAEASGA